MQSTTLKIIPSLLGFDSRTGRAIFSLAVSRIALMGHQYLLFFVEIGARRSSRFHVGSEEGAVPVPRSI